MKIELFEAPVMLIIKKNGGHTGPCEAEAGEVGKCDKFSVTSNFHRSKVHHDINSNVLLYI